MNKADEKTFAYHICNGSSTIKPHFKLAYDMI